MGSVPLGLIAALRPWPTEARAAAEGLAGEGRGALWRLGLLSEQAAGSLLQARLGRPLPESVQRRGVRPVRGESAAA
jgi:hypothetical protein